MKFSVKKFQVELLTTDLSHRKKTVNFICLVLLSLFSFYITYRATASDTNTLFWQLKSFIGIAVAQSVAQISIGWYILKNKLPFFVTISFQTMALLSQLTYAISIVVVAEALRGQV